MASTPTVDRDDEVVEARCFLPLPKQVPVRSAQFGGEQVGSGRPYYSGGDLLVEGRFASTRKAQEVRTLVREGHLVASGRWWPSDTTTARWSWLSGPRCLLLGRCLTASSGAGLGGPARPRTDRDEVP